MPVGACPREPVLATVLRELLERLGHEPDVMPVGFLDLVNLRGVHVEVQDPLRVLRELRGIARNAVVEAGAHGDEQVAVVH